MAELYKVEEIVEKTQIVAGGKISKVYRIAATSASGIRFTADIPESDLTKKKVAQILTEKATLMEDVKNL